MTAEETKEARRGSQLRLQRLVDQKKEMLDREIIGAAKPQATSIDWKSPLRSDGYKEHADAAFLEQIQQGGLKPKLSEFWPANGPVWDGLGVGVGTGEVFLVEAKAHLGELFSGGCQAGPASKAKIKAALEKTQHALGIKPEASWTGALYQYANRVAHLWWLRDQGVQAFLVYVCFLNEPSMNKAPKSREEWEAALFVMEKSLGLHDSNLAKYVAHVYFDAQDL